MFAVSVSNVTAMFRVCALLCCQQWCEKHSQVNDKLNHTTNFMVFIWRLQRVRGAHSLLDCKTVRPGIGWKLAEVVISRPIWTTIIRACGKTSGEPVPQLGHAAWAPDWHHTVRYIIKALKLDILPAASSSTRPHGGHSCLHLSLTLHSSVSQPLRRNSTNSCMVDLVKFAFIQLFVCLCRTQLFPLWADPFSLLCQLFIHYVQTTSSTTDPLFY